jgi:hypothetical protein
MLNRSVLAVKAKKFQMQKAQEHTLPTEGSA